MGKLSRAHWRGMNTAQQNAYEQAEQRGDQKAMNRIYAQIEDHHDTRSTLDKVVEGAREVRGSYRVGFRGVERWWD